LPERVSAFRLTRQGFYQGHLSNSYRTYPWFPDVIRCIWHGLGTTAADSGYKDEVHQRRQA